MRRIRTEEDLAAKGVAALVGSCAHMARVHALPAIPPLRRRPAGFKGLSRVIVGQQLSVASANAIWGRLEARVRPFTAASLLAVPEAELRAAGLSAVKTPRSASRRGDRPAVSTSMPCPTRPKTAIHAALTALKGIGPWTADIYILFCLGTADAWSPGDLALQHAVRDALALDERPGLEVDGRDRRSLASLARASPRGCSGPIMPGDARKRPAPHRSASL